MSKPPEAGVYCYGICRSSTPRSFGPLGIGAHGDEVRTLAVGEIAAVVSCSPAGTYRVSRQNVLAHQQVLEAVMPHSPVLPIRFSTVADSAAQVIAVLESRYEEFDHLLERMTGKHELGVKAIYREAVIYAELVEAEPRIQRLKQRLTGTRLEESYYPRLELGRLVEAALAAKREREGAALLALLAPHAVEHRQGRLLHERMLLNAAFLVEKARERSFDEVVEELSRRHDARIELRYVGPMPPYNFVNLTINLRAERAPSPR
ncbi:MAG: GvpL/GvpF family gas vesicle protein [Candidatus Tectomicrobia bacterium]|nr:GvpL/GvpF family gas vesicle protein [Candidatus Tectomicrobia bacterium]